jgi:hypothetical protein
MTPLLAPNQRRESTPHLVDSIPPSASAHFAALGALALGVDGLALWRQEERQ